MVNTELAILSMYLHNLNLPVSIDNLRHAYSTLKGKNYDEVILKSVRVKEEDYQDAMAYIRGYSKYFKGELRGDL